MKKRDVIIACDFPNKEETLAFLDKFKAEKPFVKIGMELFYGEGPDIVREVKSRGHSVFLDLKLHDIPNTVQSAMKNIASLGADMTNLHAAGGINMMKAALEGLESAASGARTMLIAVTQLTSISEEMMNRELCISGKLGDVVAAYAQNAKIAGLNGVVCSPLEVKLVKKACGGAFQTVTPGIRYPEGDMADQIRVTSPAEAADIGSDYIVVGRTITGAQNPEKAYAQVVKDFLTV